MKARDFSIILLIVLTIVASESYACNYSPVADLKVRQYVIVDKMIIFDGNDSYDPDSGDSITKYEWDFDGDDTYDYYETADYYPDGKFDGIAFYIYDTNETYDVSLRVTDEHSATGDANSLVYVSEDTDSDGLPDDWEYYYFWVLSEGWSGDYDSDDFNNSSEYLHETDPNDNTSTPDVNYIILVPDDANTIQKAIDICIDGDTIMVLEGTYYENLDFYDEQITLTSFDPNDPRVVATTIIDGNDSGKVIVFSTGDANSTISGFTIRNGSTSDYGAGIYCNNTSPKIFNCIISDNEADVRGGGISCSNYSSPTIKNCIFMNNSANSYGGGLGNYSNSDPNVINCGFIDNSADSYGGAVYNMDSSCPKLINCVFTNNIAQYGGGVYNRNSSSPSLVNCTFADNDANYGGGIYHYGSYPNPCTPVKNCILWGNSSDNGKQVNNYDGNHTPTFSNCDIEGSGGSSNWDTDLGVDDGNNIDSNPFFVDANDPNGADNILGTLDDGLQLRIDSPCIDEGNNVAIEDVNVDTDFAGRSRIIDGDHNSPATVDMGVYELPMIWYVDDDISGGDGTSWASAYDDLQDVLTDSNIGDSNLVWVAKGTYEPTDGTDRTTTFQLLEGVDIYGGFEGTETWLTDRNWKGNPTMLSGDIGTLNDINDNSYHVVKGADNTLLDGFIITAGDANGTEENAKGGGMYNSNCSPTVANCVFAENTAYLYGGGMYNTQSNPILINCLFTLNDTTAAGGGICNYNYSYPELINCTFSKNNAVAAGGGIASVDSKPVIINSILWGDTASDCNEVYNYYSNPEFGYCNVKDSNGSGQDWYSYLGEDLGGNIDSDPCFIDINEPAGPDDIYRTYDDGLRLDANSPCIDVADGNYAPLVDIIGLERVDIGTSDPAYADIGAYESYKGYDSDGDGMDDDYEDMFGLDKNNDDSSGDADEDGLSNLTEFGLGTRPDSKDTDNDGMDDKWENNYGLDPLDADDADDDNDGDGRDNLLEYQDGSDPTKATEVTRIVYEYDNAGQLTKEKIQDKVKTDVAVTEYQYDELGRRWQERRWASASARDNTKDMITLTSYYTRGDVNEIVLKVDTTDPNTIKSSDIVTQNYYDALGRLTDMNDAEGGNTHYTYYTGGQIYQVTDANGNTTTSYYDKAGRREKTVDAGGNYSISYYNSLGRTIKQIRYDSGDTSLSQTRAEYNALGPVTRSAVMADAGSTSAIDPNYDMVTDYVYDDVNGSYPGMLVSQTTYYGGNPCSSAATTYAYDGLGRRNLTTDPAGNKVVIGYNAKGQLINVRQETYDNPLEGEPNMVITTSFFYDSLDRLHKRIETPDTEDSNTWHISIFEYDAMGNITKETGPDGAINTYAYNALSQLTQKIADSGSSPHINQKTLYTYDRIGRQATITGYANGVTEQTTTYTYDDLSRITKIAYPDGNDIDFEYHPSGSVKKRTDQRGIETTYTYNSNYRLLTKTVDGKSVTNDAEESFTYDGLSRMLTSVKTIDSNIISKIELAYNCLGKVTDSNQELFNSDITREFDFSYDQAGYLTSTIYPYSNVTVNITPNWQGRIDTLKLGAITLVKYQYIGSRVAQRSFIPPSPDVNSDYSYDNLGRITQIHAYKGATEIVKFDYEYEYLTNNIDLIKYDHRGSDPCNTFSYDWLDRLTVAEYGIDDTNEVFYMDKLGNRTKVNVKDGNDVTYSVDNLTNRYNSVGGNNLSYDAAGNLTEDKDGYIYLFDYENRIVKITRDPNETVVAEFAYDALGRRVEKKDCIDANNTRRYYYSEKWQVLAEYNGSDSFEQWYAYGNYIDEVLLLNTGSSYITAKFYIQDHLYSSAALLWSTGSIDEMYEYDAYGQPTIYIDDGNDNQWLTDDDITADSSEKGNPYLFTGREADILDCGSLKIQYNRNRYLDYYTGRWLIHDPLGIVPDTQKSNKFEVTGQYKDGMNLYEYIEGNPTKGFDSFGLWYIGEHGSMARKALRETIPTLPQKPNLKCRLYIFDTIPVANVQQDLSWGSDKRRHYARPNIENETDNDKLTADQNYWEYIEEEEKEYFVNKLLKAQSDPRACDEALQSIGRIDHSYQDFYGHAIRRDDGFEAWTIGITGNPYRREKFWPVSIKEHGFLEPIRGAEKGKRREAAEEFSKKFYSSYLDMWLNACLCRCNSKKIVIPIPPGG